MTTAKKIVFVTGMRSDLSSLKGVYRHLKKNKGATPLLFVTGMHTQKKYGETYREIEQAEIPIDSFCRVTSRSVHKDFTIQVRALSKFLRARKIDYVMVCGDRPEMLAGAAAALFQQIPVFHIHGGDVSYGMVDDAIRHAITKISSIHFTASSLSARRVLRMGEEPWRVFHTGSPDLDDLHEVLGEDGGSILVRYGLEEKQYVVVLFNPESLAGKDNYVFTRRIIEALKIYGGRIIVISPNNDPHSDFIRKAYAQVRSDHFLFFKNLQRNEYLHLLKNCTFFIGNSSSGIIESATFKIPALNLGHRQDGRQRNTNTIDVPTISEKNIIIAIHTAMSPSYQRKVARTKNVYGSGNASKAIAQLVKMISRKYETHKLLYKKFVL